MWCTHSFIFVYLHISQILKILTNDLVSCLFINISTWETDWESIEAPALVWLLL